MYGARLIEFRTRPLPEHQKRKKFYEVQWFMKLNNVHQYLIDMWQSGYAFGNITDYTRTRKRLKIKIHNIIKGS